MRGYSIIELLVVISILGLIGTVSVTSFLSFNNTQIVEGAASDVANFYTLARQRALSQVKPTQCNATQSLRGYQVVINTVTNTYQINGLCGNSTFVIGQKKLPSNVTFANTSPTSVTFNIPNANIASQATVTINGYGKTKIVKIDPSGAISQP